MRDLVDLVERRFAEVRADVTRHNEASFAGHYLHESIDQWIGLYREHPDPALHERFDTLRASRPGTFGRAFADFYLVNAFAFPGVPEAPNQQFAVPHDAAHVLSGYDTSVQGELLVSTFTAGMHRVDALAAHIVPAIMSFHMAVPIADFAGAASGTLDPRKFWVAWSRGDQLTGDTLDHGWDFRGLGLLGPRRRTLGYRARRDGCSAARSGRRRRRCVSGVVPPEPVMRSARRRVPGDRGAP